MTCSALSHHLLYADYHFCQRGHIADVFSIITVLDDLVRRHGKRGRKLSFLPFKFAVTETPAYGLDGRNQTGGMQILDNSTCFHAIELENFPLRVTDNSEWPIFFVG